MACSSATSCAATGNYRDSSGYLHLLLVTGAGTSWTAAGAPLPANANANWDAYLASVACPSTTSCTAVGSYTDSSGSVQGLLVTGPG